MLDASPGTTFELSLNGEIRTFWYGFRAWLEIQVNPLQAAEVMAFIHDLDLMTGAKFARAGLLWEYRKDESRGGQEPPDIEYLIDHLDLPKFIELLNKSASAAGLSQKKGTLTKEGEPDPLKA